MMAATSRVAALAAALASAVGLLVVGCDSKNPTTPSPITSTSTTTTTTTTVPPTTTVPATTTVARPTVSMVAAGDIGMCGYKEPWDTAAIVDGIPGVIALLGDLAYMNGTESDFMNCFHPPWGRHVPRSRPVPGNHEYTSLSGNAAPYFSYFGAAAGTPGQGYYTYEVGEWLAIAINSNIQTGDGSAQVAWLRGVLATSRHRCTLAYWHHPLFSSSTGGNNGHMRAIWSILDAAGVEFVMNGHDHVYERFAPQDANGRYSADGIREFVVGTGGAYLYDFRTIQANSEVRGQAHGVLRLTLRPDAYDWEFVPTAAYAFRDMGTGQCY
jgi:hypothetical protein